MFVKLSTFRMPTVYAVLAGALLTAPVAFSSAQAQDAQQPPAGQSADYSEQELTNYAMAVMDVQQIGQSYDAKIQAAESEDELKELSQDRMDEMVAAVKDRGITVEKYNEIFKVSQQDPELAGEVDMIMQELAGEQ